ncbi:hypothetical protein ACH5RR_012849, partial [Cinchona calisaya]
PRVFAIVNQDKVSTDVPSSDISPTTNQGISPVEETEQEDNKALQNLEKNQEVHIPISNLNNNDFQETIAAEITNLNEKQCLIDSNWKVRWHSYPVKYYCVVSIFLEPDFPNATTDQNLQEWRKISKLITKRLENSDSLSLLRRKP